MLADQIKEIEREIGLLRDKLMTLQNEDGGFKGFYCHDTVSGVWTTAEVVHVAAKTIKAANDTWLRNGCEYLVGTQNADGGWPFRPKGKSITDITAWSCLALSHTGHHDAIRRGIDFILRARNNQGSDQEEAWGLTASEPDRVYSTWIVSYCLFRLLRTASPDSPLPQGDMSTALGEAKAWLLRIQNRDGSWGTTRGSAPRYTSTAVALLTLFAQGDNPADFRSSYEFLHSGLRNGLWEAESEVVVTQEGYELTQAWFTSIFCFRAMIFFAEMAVAPIEDTDDIFRNLLDLIREDGSVMIGRDSSADLVWTIPYMLEALDKYRAFIQSKQREYTKFLETKARRLIAAKRERIEDTLRQQFPYPVSHAFSTYQHELDYHRKFQLMIQLYEVAVKYATVVGLSGYLAARENDSDVAALLTTRFKRPSLGDWCTLLEILLKKSEGFTKLLHPLTTNDILRSRSNYLDESAPKVSLSHSLSAIIALRNTSVGHGALRTIYEDKLSVEAEESALYTLVDRMLFLAKSNSFLVLASQYDEFGEGDKYKVRIFKGLNIQDSDLETSSRLSEGQRDTMTRYIYFQNSENNTIVNLYPFLSYMFCDECKREQFFMYNGQKTNDVVLYLSYACGHILDRDNGVHFQKRFKASEIDW